MKKHSYLNLEWPESLSCPPSVVAAILGQGVSFLDHGLRVSQTIQYDLEDSWKTPGSGRAYLVAVLRPFAKLKSNLSSWPGAPDSQVCPRPPASL